MPAPISSNLGKCDVSFGGLDLGSSDVSVDYSWPNVAEEPQDPCSLVPPKLTSVGGPSVSFTIDIQGSPFLYAGASYTSLVVRQPATRWWKCTHILTVPRTTIETMTEHGTEAILLALFSVTPDSEGRVMIMERIWPWQRWWRRLKRRLSNGNANR